eukprot:488301-Prorocentrum_minimum.AAC.3
MKGPRSPAKNRRFYREFNWFSGLTTTYLSFLKRSLIPPPPSLGLVPLPISPGVYSEVYPTSTSAPC